MRHGLTSKVSSLVTPIFGGWLGSVAERSHEDGFQLIKVRSECLRSSVERTLEEGRMTDQAIGHIPQVPTHTATLSSQGAQPPLKKLPTSLNSNTALSNTQHR